MSRMDTWRPDLDSLALLTELARQGSLGKAAAASRISQPSASARIDALERRLGVQLLVRTTAGSRLTTAGELVVGWAEPRLDPGGIRPTGGRGGTRPLVGAASSSCIYDGVRRHTIIVART